MVAADVMTGTEDVMRVVRDIAQDDEIPSHHKKKWLPILQTAVESLELGAKRAAVVATSGPWVAKDFREDSGSFFTEAEKKEIRDCEKKNSDFLKERGRSASPYAHL